MLEKPDIPDASIIACLQTYFDLPVSQVEFLPLGVDVNAAVFRAAAPDGEYFVKLRRGAFDEMSVVLPRLLRAEGIQQVIAPLGAKTGQPWASLGPFRVVVYPFVEGRDGYQVDLAAEHWRDMGGALKRLHALQLPLALSARLQRETYSPQWRQAVRDYMARVEAETFAEPAAADLAALLRDQHQQIDRLVSRAEQLANNLQTRPLEFVVCHADLHAGNVLIDRRGALYLVDWDAPILAPKERDLMFIGGGQGFRGHTAAEEEALFYQGYGPTQIDSPAIAYYRYERIVQDIAAYCQEVFAGGSSAEDRQQAVRYVASNFRPGGTLEMAYRADTKRP